MPISRARRSASPRRGSLTDWLTKELARTQGWAPNDVTAVAIGNGVASIIAAFRGNLVDADISTTSLFLTMEEQKTGRILAPVDAVCRQSRRRCALCVEKLIDSNPDAVRAFVAGWIETVDYMRAHKAETVKIESEITGFPESVMSKEYDLTLDMYTKDCRFDAESLATLQAFVRRAEAPECAAGYVEALYRGVPAEVVVTRTSAHAAATSTSSGAIILSPSIWTPLSRRVPRCSFGIGRPAGSRSQSRNRCRRRCGSGQSSNPRRLCSVT